MEEKTENLVERTMVRMSTTQRRRWTHARELFATRHGAVISESDFIRMAGDALATKWGA